MFAMKDNKAFMQVALAAEKDMTGQPAPIVPFADWDFYYTMGRVSWMPPKGKEIASRVEVPIGFVTDLASIPRVFWTILPPQARYSYPAIIHDFLYWTQEYTRELADKVFKLAMADMEVPSAKTFIIYEAVRLAGGRAWSANATARLAGEKRILKKFPPSPNITWFEWKARADVFS
jgi:Protein of unknown function (DUF1353)